MICSALNWLVFIGSSWWKNPNISNWPVLGSQDMLDTLSEGMQ
jgi:hypothetical protein